ncbi:hypothetical protein ALC57_00558 [Trachymyrmex cornetzi]|uniref:Uncharacterized protein n=1 Tax=Trachymyrmex cornetzi TaxID=471704 RepID=A0A151JS12_9HYME|nr:hypothetical protein ALC57_00558 [Trachymyrmex cornetzi]
MFHCKLAFTIPNTLKHLIKRGKDKFEFLSNQNVVYKISCDDCEASVMLDVIGTGQHGIEQILMMLQAHASLGPTVLPCLPCTQPNPVTIL